MVIMRCSVLTYSERLLSFMLGDVLLVIFTLWRRIIVLNKRLNQYYVGHIHMINLKIIW